MNVEPSPVCSIAGVPVARMTLDQVCARMLEMAERRERAHVVTVAAWQMHLALHDPEFRRILTGASLVFCDGISLLIISHLTPSPLPQRVTGVDVTLRVMEAAPARSLRVFAFGGDPGAMAEAATWLRSKFPGLVFERYSPPITPAFTPEMDREAVRRINAFSPHALFVSLGTPRAEKWIEGHLAELDVGFAISVGGTFDNIAGRRPRAPRIIQSIGMEGVWRVLQDPHKRIPHVIAALQDIPAMIAGQKR